MLRLVCVGVLYLTLGCHASGSWCYEDPACGPEEWAEAYPYCGQSSQSPINIITSQATNNNHLGPIHISGSSGTSTGAVTNNGHTVEVVLSSLHLLTGAGLEDTYKLAGFHLHFGNPLVTDEGSEHLINGNAFPLEVHFVFYNTKYASLTEAKENSDGLAVVGALFQIGASNTYLDPLIDALPAVANKGETTTISINLGGLLPASVKNYYKYPGSLTTPPCSENVAWHVISTPLKLCRSQYNTIISSLYFTSSNSVERIPMENNYRPVQPLNGRIVYKYQH